MNTKRYINILKNVSPLVLLAIGFILGIVIAYLYFQPKLTDQTNTVNYLSKQLTACLKDPSSKDCISDLSGNLLFAEDCNVPTTNDTADIVWHYRHCPTPTLTLTPTAIPTIAPVVAPSTNATMPSWCKSTIKAYDAAYQPLGYSQGAINEIIKRNNPECASY